MKLKKNKYSPSARWENYEKELLMRPGFKEAAKETRLEYEIARSLINARLEKGLTQTEIAKRMNTKQSVISRVESAQTTPSLSFLKRIAKALDVEFHVQFKS